KITMSRIAIEPLVFDLVLDCSSIFTTFMRMRRSWATTSSLVAASIVALLSSPCAVRAVYTNAGIWCLLWDYALRYAEMRSTAARAAGHRARLAVARRALVGGGLADHAQELVRVTRDAQA